MITIRKIDSKNLWKVVKLSVRDDQKDFVATNTESILEAYVAVTAGDVALPFAAYDDDTLIGFVMIGYSTSGDEDEPEIADGNYTIWRFMVDKAFQGRGFGRAALAETLRYIRTMPCGHAEYCWLSYEPENTAAKSCTPPSALRKTARPAEMRSWPFLSCDAAGARFRSQALRCGGRMRAAHQGSGRG